MPARSPEPPKITLRFGGQKPGSSAGVSIDNEALKRQQDMVKAGANGQGANSSASRLGARNHFGRSSSGSGSTLIPSMHTTSQDRPRSASAEQHVGASNGVKSEMPSGQSPALGTVQLNREVNRSSESGHSPLPGTSVMPPPSSVAPRLSSHSPHPQAAANSYSWNSQSSTTSFDSRWRQPGKGKKKGTNYIKEMTNVIRCE